MGFVAKGGTYQHYLVIEHQLKPIASYFRAYVEPHHVYLHTFHFNNQNEIVDLEVLERIKALAKGLLFMHKQLNMPMESIKLRAYKNCYHSAININNKFHSTGKTFPNGKFASCFYFKKGRILMNSLKIAIIGGSLGGLLTGIALREKGHKVDIYERSAGILEDRGAGLVIQPDVEKFLGEHNLATIQEISVPLSHRQFIKGNGNIDKMAMPQLMTSWNRLYRILMDAFPSEYYHSAKRVVDFIENQNELAINFQDGTQVNADYVIAADGIGSVIRNKVLSTVSPTYAGYVAWRGTVNIEELPKDILNFFFDKFSFYQGLNNQILSYFIPNKHSDDSIRLNWVWYETILNKDELNQLMTTDDGRNYQFMLPPNQLPESVIHDQKQKAKKRLPVPFANLINITKAPFVQPIYDLEVPQMVFDKVILLGDSSFVPRPHTASGVSKAAYNAMQLAATFDMENQTIEELQGKLKEWEVDQLRLGKYLTKMGKQLGDRSALGYRH